MIDLDALHDALESALAPSILGPAYLVGRGRAPKDGGWSTGQAGEGTYRPYLVATFAGAVPAFSQTIATYEVDWRVNLTLKTFSASYEQWMAMTRTWHAQLEQFAAGSQVGDQQVVGLVWNSLGPVARDESRQPQIWSSQDSVALLCANR